MAIAVTDKGSWKLAGLEFSTKLDDDNFKWADNYPTLAQPCPAYIPPDLFENKIIDTSGELIFQNHNLMSNLSGLICIWCALI